MFRIQRKKLYLDRVRELAPFGLSLPFALRRIADPPSDLMIEQSSGEFASLLVDLPDRRTLFVVWLALIAKRPDIHLRDFCFGPPWPDNNFKVLPSFEDSHIGDQYCLSDGWEYPRNEVLNLHFGRAGWRLPNARVEGVLCALSSTTIPNEYMEGACIPVKVRFFGKSGQELATKDVILLVDRFTHHAPVRPKTEQSVPFTLNAGIRPAALARPRLFERRDEKRGP